MQLGPIRRLPAPRIFRTSSRSTARPSSLHSPKPALMMQIAGTFPAKQSSTAAGTCAAGTTMMARSTGEGIAATRGEVFKP